MAQTKLTSLASWGQLIAAVLLTVAFSMGCWFDAIPKNFSTVFVFGALTGVSVLDGIIGIQTGRHVYDVIKEVSRIDDQ